MNRNPIVPFILIIFLGIGLVFLLSSQGATTDEEGGGEDVASEEGSGEGGESAGGEGGGAAAGDFDAEGFARDNCASCHGQDFSGGMGPALAGTSLSVEEFSTVVREGRGAMPSFSQDQIADEQLTALHEFLSSQ
ncbi:cytochrome c [Salinicoccus cyprini]|uniref:Cytochrome c n=1 Tax=Salinicoccus cyprini TaxID=2493691 RepID=A0A558AYV4_9STAP|nr:cytochrome c [Salinicoccus cyprini]TVT29440.1 cytochrome c [Salinicoccus cyprini]